MPPDLIQFTRDDSSGNIDPIKQRYQNLAALKTVKPGPEQENYLRNSCMTTLETVASYAEILGVLSLVGGIIFAFIQIRQFQRQRQELAALDMLRSWQTPEFAKALRLIISLPDRIDEEAMQEHGESLDDRAIIVGGFFESAGVMVYRRLVSLDVADDLMGGVMRVAWTKLELWVIKVRQSGNPRAFEWWEWLVNRLNENSSITPDYIATNKNLNWRK
jgi:hypothetical protein